MSNYMKKLVVRDVEYEVVDETARDAIQDLSTVVSEIIDDASTADNTTWSSDKISDAIGDIIDDSVSSETKTWSSDKLESVFDNLDWTLGGSQELSSTGGSVNIPITAKEIYLKVNTGQMQSTFGYFCKFQYMPTICIGDDVLYNVDENGSQALLYVMYKRDTVNSTDVFNVKVALVKHYGSDVTSQSTMYVYYR